MGADIHAEDDEALCVAAEHGHVEVVNALLRAQPPADIHELDDAPLFFAAMAGRPEVVKALLGAHPPANIHALLVRLYPSELEQTHTT